MQGANAHWKLDKTLSLPMVGGFLLQAAVILWFVATLNARVNQFEIKAENFQPQVEKIIRLETKIDDIKENLTEIKQILRTAKLSSK